MTLELAHVDLIVPPIHAQSILEILSRDQILTQDNAESLVHALVDIRSSIETIYCKLIPKLDSSMTKDETQDTIWEIREEFRHIEYHLNDAKLTEL